MPDTAFVHGKAPCPACGAHILDGVRCQWGVLPGARYELGESVQWLRTTTGEVLPSFQLFQIAQGQWRWNCGEPKYPNVILFDMLFESDINTTHFHCPKCNARIAGSIAKTRDGVFCEIAALTEAGVSSILGSSRGKADIVVIREDGSLWAREDWYDHPVKYMGELKMGVSR